NVDGAIAPRLDAGTRLIRVEDVEPSLPRGDELDDPSDAQPVDVEPHAAPHGGAGPVAWAPHPAPEPQGEPISKPQSRRMHALMRERGMTDRAQRLERTGPAGGREAAKRS